MHQKIYQIKAYAKHWKQANSKLGHGIHSPFVYDLVETVFNHSGNYYCFPKIEKQRQRMLSNKTLIQVEDFGAGSSVSQKQKRSLSSIAQTALLDPSHAQLLFRLVNRFHSKTIIELGSSLGITSAYLASACKTAQLYTLEGSPEIAKVAQKNLSELKIKNAILKTGPFQEQLPEVLKTIKEVDFAFIDGNHRYEPTLQYFEMLLKKAHEHSVFVFDDIYWSEGMTKAWTEIIARPEVKVSIDLYRMGIIFFRKESLKQDFKIKF